MPWIELRKNSNYLDEIANQLKFRCEQTLYVS